MSVTTRGECPEAELITALVDGEVDGVTRAQITLHAGTCAECTKAIAEERRAKSAVSDLDEPALSADLTARLLAVAASEGQSSAPTRASRQRRLPTYFAAAASVVVLMVGAFTFLGATTEGGTSPTRPNQTVAIVPAADRLAQEHALTSVQTSFGGPGAAVVPVAAVSSTPAVAR